MNRADRGINYAGRSRVHQTTVGDLLALLGIGEEDWRDQALCAQTDPEAMFPEKGGSTRDGRAICGMCPVRAIDLGGTGECLEFALQQGERYGIWGGKTERERRLILRERAETDQAWADGTAGDRVA